MPQPIHLRHDVAVESHPVVGVDSLAAALLVAAVHVRNPPEGRDAQGPRRPQVPVLSSRHRHHRPGTNSDEKSVTQGY